LMEGGGGDSLITEWTLAAAALTPIAPAPVPVM
jgi:hypothetical protein